MSGFFRNIDPQPLTTRRMCTPPPLVREEDTLAGWRGGGGRKTLDTALCSIYVSTLWRVPSRCCQRSNFPPLRGSAPTRANSPVSLSFSSSSPPPASFKGIVARLWDRIADQLFDVSLGNKFKLSLWPSNLKVASILLQTFYKHTVITKTFIKISHTKWRTSLLTVSD
jgi:hypothetical protein